MRSTTDREKFSGGRHLRKQCESIYHRGVSNPLRRLVEFAQYVSILYTERLAQASIEPSVGSRGDSYDNALAEKINGLYKTELIHRRAPWKTKESLELTTLEWVSWFNQHRLLEPIGYLPPAEAEANHYRQLVKKTETPVSL